MGLAKIIVNYLGWHYSRALADFWRIYKNIIVFFYNFFSLPILVRSFFAPWKRMGEDYPIRSLDFGQIVSVFVVNALMRLVGMIMRTVIILVGLIFVILALISGPVILIFWLALPFLLLALFFAGFYLIIGG